MFYRLRKVFQFIVHHRKNSTYSCENLLNTENRQRTLAKLHRMKPIRLQTQEPVKKAAILVPICIADKKVSLLYVIRSSNLTEYKEKVNFPGDVQVTSDHNISAAARRVASNLLGLASKDIQIWGVGNIIVARSDYTFVPVIGEITGKCTDDRFTLNESVEEVFTVPVEDLCNSKTNAYTQFKDDYSTPVFMGGKWRIWGFTAIITNIVLSALVPPQGYGHHIKQIPALKRGTKFPITVKYDKK